VEGPPWPIRPRCPPRCGRWNSPSTPTPPTRPGCGGALADLDGALARHSEGVTFDGLITESTRVGRPSLGRQEDRLRERLWRLHGLAIDLHRRATAGGPGADELRDESRQLAASVRTLRDAEAGLAFDAKHTDIGGGD
jgi:hypothetical protein